MSEQQTYGDRPVPNWHSESLRNLRIFSDGGLCRRFLSDWHSYIDLHVPGSLVGVIQAVNYN